MDYSTHGANMWNIHFLGPANMQKISILQCKMEFFCIFSIYQKWTTLLMGQTCGISIFWGQQICKKSPFYSVKWNFFASFPFTKNGLLYSWFWGQQTCKKIPFYRGKLRFLHIVHLPKMDYSTHGANMWNIHLEIFGVSSIYQKWTYSTHGANL